MLQSSAHLLRSRRRRLADDGYPASGGCAGSGEAGSRFKIVVCHVAVWLTVETVSRTIPFPATDPWRLFLLQPRPPPRALSLPKTEKPASRLLVYFCFPWIPFVEPVQAGCPFHRRQVPGVHGCVETMLASRGLAEADDLAHCLICRASVRHWTSPTRSRSLSTPALLQCNVIPQC